MTTQTPDDKLKQWERSFAPGLVASSREKPEPWLAGSVHVVSDAPPQPEPVRTEQGSRHGLILITGKTDDLEDRTEAGPVHCRGKARPGDLHVYSKARNEEPHLTRWSGPCSFLNVALEAHVVHEACRAADLDYERTEFVDSFSTQDALLEPLIRQLGAELQTGAPGGRLYAEQLMQTVAAHLVRHYTSGQHVVEDYTGGLPSFRLQRVKEYVAAHLAGDITLDDLAEAAGAMNPYHFSRLFKASTGTPPYQYVIERRVEKAERLLVQTDLPIFQVALEVGYGSQSYFTRLFKKHIGATPGAYRREAQR